MSAAQPIASFRDGPRVLKDAAPKAHYQGSGNIQPIPFSSQTPIQCLRAVFVLVYDTVHLRT